MIIVKKILNYNERNKSAIGYRLNPSIFLDKKKYPVTPFAIFMFIGREFRVIHHIYNFFFLYKNFKFF